MSPESIFQNATTFLLAVSTVLAALCAAAGGVLYALGKAGDSPRFVAWAKNSWMGAFVALGTSTVFAIIQNVATRVWG